MSDQGATRRRKIAGERTRRTTEADPTTAAPIEPDPDAEAIAGTQPGGKPQTEPGTSAIRHLPNWLLVGLGVVLAAVVVFDVIVAVKYDQRKALVQTRDASVTSAYNTAPAQAEKAATQILGYDYSTLQQDATEAKSFMTDSYAETFQKTVDGLLTAPAKQVKAHVEAKVMASGVASAQPNQVQVLLFVDQVSVTTANKEPQTALNRVVFTMVKSGDRWLVSEITAL